MLTHTPEGITDDDIEKANTGKLPYTVRLQGNHG
jgi:hypothetical protein